MRGFLLACLGVVVLGAGLGHAGSSASLRNDNKKAAATATANANTGVLTGTELPIWSAPLEYSGSIRLAQNDGLKLATATADPFASLRDDKGVVLGDDKGRARLDDPDAACAGCHRAVYEKYEKTPMARGSGRAVDALQAGAFHHSASGIDYRVFLRDGAGWMSFSRDGAESLSGERRLEYFVGSGRRGRTYLYEQGGQWFELPINFYTRRDGWGMAPAFDEVKTMPAVLPTDANCLHCHATEVGVEREMARNRFVGAPFKQGGVGCSACHGDGAAHVAAKGLGEILNPGKMSVAKRDSACLQCHLEGDAVVYKPGRSLAMFKAGDDLAETAVYFIRASQGAGGARATSQYEALLRSACKRGSGDKLTCTTCHDPHGSPAAAERVGFFRAKCLACHTGVKMATAHHPEQQDCAACHMPTRPTTDISHDQVTDHDVEARPGLKLAEKARGMDELVTVGGVAATDAEFGMAYAQLAAHGNVAYGQEALRRLTHAASLGPLDAPAEVQLGYLRQLSGLGELARGDYAAVLKASPYEATALANLAVIDASSGKVTEAVGLLQRLVEADPSQTAAGLNLAFILCRVGKKDEAKGVLERLRVVNPDDAGLRRFMGTGVYGGERCLAK